MKTIQFNKPAFLSYIPYTVKCVAGIAICYILYKAIPQYPFYWSIVSVVLVFAPGSGSSLALAFDRIKANVLGCSVGIGLYCFTLPELFLLCLGAVLTICAAVALRLTDTLRVALAALVIVTIQEEQTKQWHTAPERVMCVVTGCLVALMVTLAYDFITNKFGRKKPTIINEKHSA